MKSNIFHVIIDHWEAFNAIKHWFKSLSETWLAVLGFPYEMMVTNGDKNKSHKISYEQNMFSVNVTETDSLILTNLIWYFCMNTSNRITSRKVFIKAVKVLNRNHTILLMSFSFVNCYQNWSDTIVIGFKGPIRSQCCYKMPTSVHCLSQKKYQIELTSFAVL